MNQFLDTLRKPKIYALALLTLTSLLGCVQALQPTTPTSDIYPTKARAEIDHIYVFGDSLSDTGNLFTLINHLFLYNHIRMEAPPASTGGQKFSNGHLVAEYIAAHYGLTLKPAWAPGPNMRNTLEIIKDEDIAKLITWLIAFKRKEEIPQKHLATIKLISESLGQRADGNNYAVANATIIPYEGILNKFFAQFSLSKQVGLHQEEDIDQRTSAKTLHLLIIGGNDITMIINGDPSQPAQDQKTQQVARAYIEQIERLRKMGAKKILVSTAPKIGETPAFYQTAASDQANHLSHLLEQEVSRQIKQHFSANQVGFVSISQAFDSLLRQWPQPRQHQACVQDITSRYFNLEHFILHDGELAAKFINDCNQQALDSGSFVFYDHFHATDKLYQLITRYYIDAIDKLMQ